jgi:hypothetical protein
MRTITSEKFLLFFKLIPSQKDLITTEIKKLETKNDENSVLIITALSLYTNSTNLFKM